MSPPSALANALAGDSMSSLRPAPASSGLVAPSPTTTLSNRAGFRAAANNSADVPTSGPTACIRSTPRCTASSMTKSPIAGITARPLFQFFECFAEVVQDRVVDVFDRSVRGHDGKEVGNPVHHLAKSELVLHRSP